MVFTADNEKTYRQIRVREEDLQHIFRRTTPNEPLQEFHLTTVTYMTTATPYLAFRMLLQLAKDKKETHPDPEIAEVIQNDFYVDDLISGRDDYDNDLRVQQVIITVMKKGGVNLRKWSSNSSKVLQTLGADMIDQQSQKMGVRIYVDERLMREFRNES